MVSRKRLYCCAQVLAMLLFCLAWTNLWIGTLSSHQSFNWSLSANNGNNNNCTTTTTSHNLHATLLESRVQSLLAERQRVLEQSFEDRVQKEVQKRLLTSSSSSSSSSSSGKQQSVKSNNQQQQDQSIKCIDASAAGGFSQVPDLVKGLAATPRANFLDGLGTPASDSEQEKNVLILYGSSASLPNELQQSPTTDVVFLNSSDQSLQHCESVLVLPVKWSNPQSSCLALVPHSGPGHHVQHWARLSPRLKNNKGIEYESYGAPNELRVVSRGITTRGIDEFQAPRVKTVQQAFDLLQTYFQGYQQVVKDIQEMVQSKRLVPHEKNDNKAIVVMVSNWGNAEMLANFVCAAKARQLDVSAVLVFATDRDTLEFCQELGIAAVYNHQMFQKIPAKHTARYGDATFAWMMAVKIISVQLVAFAGYDVLFQDADVIWYQHPLTDYFLKDNRFDAFDIIGQDDGARNVRFTPYFMNSGFYFVRYNARSLAFLNSLLLSIDLVLCTRSHQQAMIEVMSQTMSLHGLKIQVIPRESPDLPCGYHFHTRKDYMQSMVQNKTIPVVFHMSWTLNKDNKVLFMKQMDQWFIREECVADTFQELKKGLMSSSSAISSACCSTEPLFACSYKDAPSTRPCHDSPNLNKGRPSFWQGMKA